MKRARIICNGDPDDLTIYDADTGKPINIPIAEVRWTISAQDRAKLQLIGYGYAATVEGEATIVAIPPWRTDEPPSSEWFLGSLANGDVSAVSISNRLVDGETVLLREDGREEPLTNLEAWMPLPPRYVKEG